MVVESCGGLNLHFVYNTKDLAHGSLKYYLVNQVPHFQAYKLREPYKLLHILKYYLVNQVPHFQAYKM